MIDLLQPQQRLHSNPVRCQLSGPFTMLIFGAGKSDKKGPEDNPEFKQLVDQVSKSSGNIIAVAGILVIAALMRSFTRPDTQEISFQHFKTQLLAKDVVDRIEVANKTTAKVLSLLIY